MPPKPTKGRLLSIFVDVGGTDTLVAGRRNYEYNETTDTIEVTTADSDKWKEFIDSFQEGEATIDGLLLIDAATGSLEASQQFLRDAKRSGDLVKVVRSFPNDAGDGTGTEHIKAIITDLTETASYDGAAEYSATFKQTGAPIDGSPNAA